MVKKLGLILVLAILLVGCGVPAEEVTIPVRIVEVVVTATPEPAPTAIPTPEVEYCNAAEALQWAEESLVVMEDFLDINDSVLVYLNNGEWPPAYFGDVARDILAAQTKIVPPPCGQVAHDYAVAAYTAYVKTFDALNEDDVDSAIYYLEQSVEYINKLNEALESLGRQVS